MPGETYLSTILEAHRARATADRRDVDRLLADALASPAPRDFAGALRGASSGGEPSLAVIAEIKRRSPSKGPIAPDLDVAATARHYAAGGAACLSVLTDRAFFAGSPEDLALARNACDLPVLRKDFTVSAADVADARLMGADAVLLIAAALSDDELASFVALAGRLQLAALVEIHDEDEASRALAAGASLVGVNQRDLRSFAVDRERAEKVAGYLPAGVLAIAESGVTGPDDARRLAAAGYRAVLVGEHLVRSADRQRAVAELAAVPAGPQLAGAAGPPSVAPGR